MKYISSLFLLFVSVISYAQIKKGQLIWTGQINSQFIQTIQITSKAPLMDAGISGDASLFISNGLAIGLSIRGLLNTYEIKLEDLPDFRYKVRSSSGSLNPFVRKYWKLSPFLVYVGGGANLTAQKLRDHTSGDRLSQNWGVSANTQLGVIYPLTTRLGLEFGARSDVFPLSINTVQLGLVVYNASGIDIKNEEKAGAILRKGRWTFSGSFSHSVSKGYSVSDGKRDEYRDPSTFIEFSPGFFINDRLLLGLGLYSGFQGGVLHDSGQSAFATMGDHVPFLVGVRPSLKKYFSNGFLSPYLQGYASYDRIMGGGPSTNSYNAGSNFGLAVVLGKNWVAEARLFGLSAGYSEVGDTDVQIATIMGVERFNVKLDAGFKPNFTVSYLFR